MTDPTGDQVHLRRAIALATAAREGGDPPFGSLLVDAEGTVLAEDQNTTISDNDITAHPELKLARWAAANLTPKSAATTTMYTSCEPCGMCANAIARSGLGRVVYALSNEQLSSLRPAGFVPLDSVRADYVGPDLFDEAAAALRGYYG
ncbi:nucleoside deaminase [Nakamurella silvestris]|nr:nucleoside deaminase [Nakamurella silvestris]